jgi:hypothetical protein
MSMIIFLFCISVLSTITSYSWMVLCYREQRRIESMVKTFEDLSDLVFDYSLFVDHSGLVGEKANSKVIAERWNNYHLLRRQFHDARSMK